MNILLRHGAILGFSFLLCACGTTSTLKPEGSELSRTHSPSLAAYNKVIVLDFVDNEESKFVNGGEAFAKRIASKVAQTKAFESVSREQASGKALVISGKIREYKEGNVALRALIGFGAGSSYFDADVAFSDNETGKKIGDIKVDKNSWALGGVIAATQDVASHMDSAASSIANQLKKAKGIH